MTLHERAALNRGSSKIGSFAGADEPLRLDRLGRQTTTEGGVKPASAGQPSGAFDKSAIIEEDVPPSGASAFRSTR